MSNIVFFDGYCILCNGLVDFLLQVDTRQKLKFASLQGTTAKKHIPASYLVETDSIIFINNTHEILIKSKAIIEILKTLGGFWKIFSLFSIIPEKILNIFYDFIAKNRYGWFGKRDQCRIPTPEEKNRILP